MGDRTSVENPPYFSLSYNNYLFSHCGRAVVVVGGCGGTNSTDITTPSSVLPLS